MVERPQSYKVVLSVFFKLLFKMTQSFNIFNCFLHKNLLFLRSYQVSVQTPPKTTFDGFDHHMNGLSQCPSITVSLLSLLIHITMQIPSFI